MKSEVSFSQRVRSALLEMLPSGQATVDDLTRQLLVCRRTLQRRLGEEGTTFKAIFSSVRIDHDRRFHVAGPHAQDQHGGLRHPGYGNGGLRGRTEL